MKGRTELLFISWQPHCSRSDSIAERLGGVSEMVYADFFGSRYSTVLLKYAWQTFATMLRLLKHRPRVVFVMTPPVAACLVVWIYCTLGNRRFVIDAHSGAFVDSPWERVGFLQRFFSRKADLTIVTNRHFKELIERWGGKPFIIADVPMYLEEGHARSGEAERAAGGNQGCNTEPADDRYMTLVSSFTGDEPIVKFFEAAAHVPEVVFYVTGDHRKATEEVLGRKPGNVRLTGFLPRNRYIDLLRHSGAVIALTTSDHTMQRGAYEGVYLGRPVITSDFPILRDAFPKGTVHVKGEVADIVEGVRRVRDDLDRYEREVRELRREKLTRWNQLAMELNSMLSLPSPPIVSGGNA